MQRSFYNSKWGEGQTFFVGGGGNYDDVHEEINVSEASFFASEANIFVSEVSVSKLSCRSLNF